MRGYDGEVVYPNRKITPIARDIMRLHGGVAPRIADIGCYKRPVSSFLMKEFPECSFLGVDEDPDALEWLAQNGIDGCSFDDYKDRGSFDFTFALEVIEHIKPKNSIPFLKTIVERSNCAVFLTTPNFSGFTGSGRDDVNRSPATKEMRYIPDHLKNFKANSDNPHHHKQALTGSRLSDDLEAVVPVGWGFSVFEAWPWSLTDFSNEASYLHSFKLYAVVWDPKQFSGDVFQEILINNLSNKSSFRSDL